MSRARAGMTTQPWLFVLPLLVLLLLLLLFLFPANLFSCTQSLFLASAVERKRPSEKRNVDTIYKGKGKKDREKR
jgi:hypothetical protein